VQEVPSSNLGGPTKTLKDLHDLGSLAASSTGSKPKLIRLGSHGARRALFSVLISTTGRRGQQRRFDESSDSEQVVDGPKLTDQPAAFD